MPDRDVEARRQLEVLEAVALDGTITQRSLDNPDGMIEILVACGLVRDRLICLHPEEQTTAQHHWQGSAVTQKAAR